MIFGKIAGQRQGRYKGASSCALCCSYTARVLPCFFLPNTLPFLWRAWAGIDTTDASMGNRDVTWKRDCLGQQVIQEYDTQSSLGKSSEIIQSAGGGKAVVKRRVWLLLPLPVATWLWRSAKEGRLEDFAAIMIKHLILHWRESLKLGVRIFTL